MMIAMSFSYAKKLNRLCFAIGASQKVPSKRKGAGIGPWPRLELLPSPSRIPLMWHHANSSAI
jgi:hypothetical protein